MLTAVVTALLVVIMVLLLASFVLGALHQHRRHKRASAVQSTLPAHPLDRHVTAVLHMQDGNVVRVEQTETTTPFSLPASWYARRRTFVTLGLLVMLALAFVIQGGLAGGDTVQSFAQGLGLAFANHTSPAVDKSAVVNASPAVAPVENASTRVVRVNSAARSEYYTDYQYNVWSYASCSGIAMETVMNAYGHHYIAADVLQKEAQLGVWDSNLGLLREEGIAMTAATYGFATDAGHTRSVQDVVNIANKGNPVIVSVRDSYYYPGGHIFVVRGGDGQYVYLADSSLQNFQRMTYPMFIGMWQGFSAVLTPQS